MRLERFGERDHSVADVITLSAVVCLDLVTWSYLGGAASVPLWKSYVSVMLAVLLALASLTRQPHRASTMRFLTGGRMMAAPYLLDFTDIPAAPRAYLAIGALLTMAASTPGASASRSDAPLPTAQLF